MSSNRGLWSDFGVVEELTEQAAETISGGAESFFLYNGTDSPINFNLDGDLWRFEPYAGATLFTSGNGIIAFDEEFSSGLQAKSYNLDDGGRYVFGSNLNIAGNAYGIDMRSIA